MRFPFDELALENRLLRCRTSSCAAPGCAAACGAAGGPGGADGRGVRAGAVRGPAPRRGPRRYDVCRERARGRAGGCACACGSATRRWPPCRGSSSTTPAGTTTCACPSDTPVVRHPEVPQPVARWPWRRRCGSWGWWPARPACRRWTPSASGRGWSRLWPPCAPGGWRSWSGWRGRPGRPCRGRCAGRRPLARLHFVGHGGVRPARRGAGGGATPGAGGPGGRRGRTASTPLTWAGCSPTTPRCAWRCSTPARGPAASGRDIFAGTAATLMRRGLPAVVAMQFADHRPGGDPVRPGLLPRRGRGAAGGRRRRRRPPGDAPGGAGEPGVGHPGALPARPRRRPLRSGGGARGGCRPTR